MRLCGGKGGFGALLRGQGRDGKITDNFDAMRDLSGRRIRHVEAEKKLQEWKQDAKERELEVIAMRHMKEMAKQAKADRDFQVGLGCAACCCCPICCWRTHVPVQGLMQLLPAIRGYWHSGAAGTADCGCWWHLTHARLRPVVEPPCRCEAFSMECLLQTGLGLRCRPALATVGMLL
jgi:hypothetical protein